MSNILVISPVSIAGSITMRGLANAFKKLNNNVLLRDVRELDYKELHKFKPNFTIGYDYSYLHDYNNSKEIIESLNTINFHWFLDDPYSNFAHSNDLTLFDKLSHTHNTIFCWDKDNVRKFNYNNETFYLPTGIDVDLYKNNKYLKIPDSSILFIGRPLTDKRQKILSEINRHFPNKLSIYCYPEHFEKSLQEMGDKNYFKYHNEEENYKNCYKGFLETEEQIATAYYNCDVALNITMDQSISSMNNRILEVLNCGALLLTDDLKDTKKYFVENEDFLCYYNTEDLLNKIKFYLHESKYCTIGRNAQLKIRKKHSLIERAKFVLNIYNLC